MPNITGAITPYLYGWSNAPIAVRGQTGNASYGIGFNAANSNGIYGKSNTVTPLSKKCLFLIKY